MSLLIKGMDMPKNCYYYRFNYDNLCHALRASFSYIHENDISCPLSEIPTHGRLIDADRLIVALKNSVYANTFFRTPTLTMSQIDQLIEHQPTVIEAEQGDV